MNTLPAHPVVSYKRRKITKYRKHTFALPIKVKFKDAAYITSFLLVFGLYNGMDHFIYAQRVKAFEPLLSPVPHTVAAPSPSAYVYGTTLTLNQLGPDTKPEKTEKTKILEYLVEKFGDDASEAITMIRKCENSKFDQKATNYNRNKTTDFGIMMINSIHENGICKGLDFKNSWKDNIDCGRKIYKADGNRFYSWSCASVVDQESYKDNL